MEFHGLPWWNWALQLLGLGSSYLGAELNARLDIRGFYIWLFSNVVMFILHVASGLWILCVLDLAFFRVNYCGALKWRKDMPTKPAAAVNQQPS